MRGDVKDVYCHVRRHEMNTLPQDEKGLGEWLKEDFRKRDTLLDGFAARSFSV